jgi:hypothetical protein
MANQAKLVRYAFIPQLFVSVVFLGFAYKTGKVHSHLLFRGVRTQGRIVRVQPVQFQSHSSGSSGASFTSTAYMPIIEFHSDDHIVRIQEWKGSSSRPTIGSIVPVLYDPSDTSFAMMDRDLWNWFPWAPCFAMGLLLVLAALKGFLAFAFKRDAEPSLSRS